MTGFSSAADITVENGSLSAMTSADDITWTGTFTPTAAIEDANNILSLAATYTDIAGNTGVTATTANYTVDTIAPAVSSFTLSDSSLRIGDTATVTLVFSEAVTGFSSAADITVENGSLSAMTSADDITWTGTFTPTAAIEDANNILSLAATYTDIAGNTGVTATTANYTVDTIAPAVSSFTLSDSSLRIGDTATVTLVFSEAVTGFSSAADITVENGSLSAMTSADDITWTGTFTPTAAIEDANNILSLAATYTDIAGNTGVTATTANYTVDTTSLTLTSIAIQGTAVILTFSEAVTASSVLATAFSVQTGSRNNTPTNRTITNVALDQNSSNKVILTLSGTAPASNVNLRVSYTDPAGAQSTGDVQDLAGNDLASFPNRYADTFITSLTTTLASQYQNLTLSDTSRVSGTPSARKVDASPFRPLFHQGA